MKKGKQYLHTKNEFGPSVSQHIQKLAQDESKPERKR